MGILHKDEFKRKFCDYCQKPFVGGDEAIHIYTIVNGTEEDRYYHKDCFMLTLDKGIEGVTFIGPWKTITSITGKGCGNHGKESR